MATPADSAVVVALATGVLRGDLELVLRRVADVADLLEVGVMVGRLASGWVRQHPQIAPLASEALTRIAARARELAQPPTPDEAP